MAHRNGGGLSSAVAPEERGVRIRRDVPLIKIAIMNFHHFWGEPNG